MLDIRNLHKSYDNKEVVHGIDLKVEDGEIFGFIGHNGAGKTTTIKCVVGILDFEQGEIFIDGVNIKDDPIRAKSITSFLPDNPDLYENLSGIQYLSFICDVFKIDKNNRNPEIEKLSKEFELYEHLGDQIKGYSHGMKQKLAIISSLIHDPKLLILDEPFVGLDPKAAFIMKNKLKELCDKGGSVFFSSHVLEVVENLCDKIAIIKSGEIIRNGSTNELLNSGESLEDLFLDLENNNEWVFIII